MDIELGRHRRIDPVEELAELDGSMASMRFRDDRACLRVECGK
jgi:hypothetical protein